MLLAVLMQAGCVSYSGKALPRLTGFPQAKTKASVGVVYSFRTYLNNKERPSTEFFRETFQKKIIERMNQSGLFSSVSLNSPNADLQLQVEVKHYGFGYDMLARLCGATLTIIPFRAEDDYQVTANVVNKKTNATTKIEVADSQVMWIHLLLFPALPFSDSQKTFEKKTLNNLMDTLALRVYETTAVQ